MLYLQRKHYKFLDFKNSLFSTRKFNHISINSIWKPLNKRRSKWIYSKSEHNKISWHTISESRKWGLSGCTIHIPISRLINYRWVVSWKSREWYSKLLNDLILNCTKQIIEHEGWKIHPFLLQISFLTSYPKFTQSFVT